MNFFNKYKEKISNISLNTIDKNTILTNDFLIEHTNNLNIYYAPHNEYQNKKAKIVIVGICPGWQQTKRAYETAKEGLDKKLSNEEILKNCKLAARFAGSMRINITTMLDELGLNKLYHIETTKDLFEDNELLHTTSVIPYPVFIQGKNYTGHEPKITESEVLMKYVSTHFFTEISVFKNALIIPLGKAVEEVLSEMVKTSLIKEEQCLFGFPHPSGANGHRKKQFQENKEALQQKIVNFLNTQQSNKMATIK